MRRTSGGTAGWLLFGLAAAGSAALILIWTRGSSFALDEWQFVLGYDRWDPATLLHPDDPHLIVAPLVLYKLLVAIFGLGTHLPVRLYSLALNITVAGLLYELAQRRLGRSLGLAAAVLVLFLGAGWEVIANPAAVDYGLAMVGGLGMFLCLMRGDRRGDVLACALLTLALASFSVGIAFAAGAAVALLSRGRRAALERWWVVVIPSLLYLVWLLWSLHFASSGSASTTTTDPTTVLRGIVDQLASISSALTGTFHVGSGTAELDAIRGRGDRLIALALVGVALAAFVATRGRRSPLLAAVAVTLAVYLLLIALGQGGVRGAAASRYVWMGSILVLVVLVELAYPFRPSAWVKAGVWALVAFALIANLRELHAAGPVFSREATYDRAELGAIDLLRGHVTGLTLVEASAAGLKSKLDLRYPASVYFAAKDANGSPAYSETQLAAAPEGAREVADMLMLRALVVGITPLPRGHTATPGRIGLGPTLAGRANRRGRCVELLPAKGGLVGADLTIPAGGLAYRTAKGVGPSLKIGRFGSRPTIGFMTRPGAGLLAIPSDRSRRRWRAEIYSSRATRVCPA